MSATASYGAFYLLGLAISLPLARVGIVAWNWLAQISDALPPLPAEADGFSAAALAGVVAWLLGRTIPKLSEDHKESNNNLANKIESMGDKIATKIDDGNKEQMRYLRELTQTQKRGTA